MTLRENSQETGVADHTIRHVLWDWNGTLLDDVGLCVRILNVLCERRGIPCVARETYLREFTFPLIEYYRAVGFDFEKEPYDVPVQEWVELYGSLLHAEARLHEGVEDVLGVIRERGVGQTILSANQKDMLTAAVERCGIAGYFEAVLGIDDHYAESKVAIGERWLAETHLQPHEVVLVGDTLHDWEVASAMGIGCVLVAAGHQERRRLEATGVPVLDSLAEVPRHFGW